MLSGFKISTFKNIYLQYTIKTLLYEKQTILASFKMCSVPSLSWVIIVRSGPLTLKEKFFRSIIQLYKVDWTKVERERKRD